MLSCAGFASTTESCGERPSTILTRSTILPLWFPFAQLASSLSSFTGVAYLVAGSLGPADATGCSRSSGSHSLITSSRFAQTYAESDHTNRNTQLLFLAYCTFTQYSQCRNVPPLSPGICWYRGHIPGETLWSLLPEGYYPLGRGSRILHHHRRRRNVQSRTKGRQRQWQHFAVFRRCTFRLS